MPLIAWRNCDECLVSWKGGQEIEKTGENEVTSNTGFRAVTGVNEWGGDLEIFHQLSSNQDNVSGKVSESKHLL